MDWLVKNAISRDVERQHLNKILQEIRRSIDTINTRLSQDSTEDARIRAVVAQMVANGRKVGINVTYNPTSKAIDFVVNDLTVQLTGDVVGSGTVSGLGTLSITTTLTRELQGIGDAPMDGSAYWRALGEWEAVPIALESIAFLEGAGILVLDADQNWYAREIEGVATETVVTEGAGLAGNPVIGVAPEIRQGVGRVPYEAAGTIHGRRAVAADSGTIYHPDLSTDVDAVRIIGIALQAGVATDILEVQTAGPITDASWSWVAGPVYVDDDGVLTQTAPTTGWIVCIGVATAPDTINVNILLPILRS